MGHSVGWLVVVMDVSGRRKVGCLCCLQLTLVGAQAQDVGWLLPGEAWHDLGARLRLLAHAVLDLGGLGCGGALAGESVVGLLAVVAGK